MPMDDAEFQVWKKLDVAGFGNFAAISSAYAQKARQAQTLRKKAVSNLIVELGRNLNFSARALEQLEGVDHSKLDASIFPAHVVPRVKRGLRSYKRAFGQLKSLLEEPTPDPVLIAEKARQCFKITVRLHELRHIFQQHCDSRYGVYRELLRQREVTGRGKSGRSTGRKRW